MVANKTGKPPQEHAVAMLDVLQILFEFVGCFRGLGIFNKKQNSLTNLSKYLEHFQGKKTKITEIKTGKNPSEPNGPYLVKV
jgi:hypothetical protein